MVSSIGDPFLEGVGPIMKSTVVIGVAGALVTGLAIGVQSTLSSRVGGLIGGSRTGLLTNAVGGVIAGVVVLLLLLRQGIEAYRMPAPAITMLVVAGILGIGIISGIAFSFQHTGVAAGVATLIAGQLAISVVADSQGWGGATVIPVTPRRLIGLLVMAVAVYLLLPRE
jgi:transporter family-2 protein